ncbi:hypothetical protein VitviT2T_005306 [Vitis vinifera]|uniref:SWIM-type domain-containing protein n=1 Tax=Vitis vinifera TaxID=29760 RepID=A0ABY9BS59_VITVI|nr:hypothetical protein VitviT2T_005306 [Vitis vinifera]|eukprot:XP_019074850.1 PREDICTED: uncharacterized protein LOC109122464 [Vitis vinifera]
MSSEIDKELNGDSMLMHKSRHIHCDSVQTLTVDGENGPRFQNESLKGYKVHDWNMNETAINEEDYRMNTNPTSDKQVTQIGSFRTGSAQSAEILTMIDTSDGFIHDNPTIIEDVANERQNMMQQPIVSGISDDHLEEHQIYSSKKELQRKLYMMALKRKFEFKTTKSTTKLLLLECFDKECKWRVCATKLGISNMFQIMKFYSTHTCRLDMMSRDNRHASSWLIGESIRETYQGVGCEFRPKDIVVDIRKQYGIQISYDKAWRAKELALGSIRGSPEESYNTLPSYCYVLEQKNPGTITDIVTDCDNQFKYFFMSIGASLAGFHTSIRPVVAVDGTFLKAKYLGTLFIAACKDGNNQIYPLAFGIGDSENDASWEWFLQKLYDALGHIDDLFVISDRHGSIEKAVHKVFPHARHGVCTYHVGQNLKTKFKNPVIHKLFHDAAHAYRVSEFNFIFGQLEMIDPRAARYLMDIGVDRWARSYSTGKRYNIMTTGIVESLNAVLKNARDLPILQLVEELRNLLQKWFVTRQQQTMSMSTELTMWADGELRSRYNMSATYVVEPINSKECNVNYAGISAQVNLDTRSCTCRKFDLDHIPCAHAIAACRF